MLRPKRYFLVHHSITHSNVVKMPLAHNTGETPIAEIESEFEKENRLSEEGVSTPKTRAELEPSDNAARKVVMPIKGRGEQNDSTCCGTVDENQEEEEAAELTLCLCFSSGILGIAAFKEVTSVMYIGQVIIPDAMASKEDLVQLISAPVLEGSSSGFNIKPMKNSYFESSRAVSTICNHLEVKELLIGRSHPVDGSGAYNLLSSFIDFSAEQSIRALGALLVHLQATAFALEPDGAVHAASIREVPWLSCLRIDQLSLKALNIFNEEAHPSIFNGKGRPKEGFSLFSLLDRTTSGPGRRELRNWLAAPSTDLNIINLRQDCIELFSTTENTELVSQLAKQLRKVTDIPRALLRIKRVAALPKHWSSLATSMEAVLLSRDILLTLHRRSPCPETVSLLEWLISMIDPVEVDAVRNAIMNTIDVDATASTVLLDVLRAVGRVILDETEMPQLSVEYLSQIGFLVTFPEELASYAPNSFEFCFQANGQLFCKCDRVRQLDDSIGDIQALIGDTQAGLLREIEDTVLRKEVPLQSAAAALAKVDALLALSSSARDLRLVRPRVVSENVIYIKVIGLTDRIFTRINSVESCSLPQGSFAIDASQVSKMMHNLTPRSLLLVDEFGKGTSPADGAALVERNGDGQQEEVSSCTNIHPSKKIGNHPAHIAPSCDFQLENPLSTNEETCRNNTADPSATSLDGVAAFQMVVHIPTTNLPSRGKVGGTSKQTAAMNALSSPVPLFKLTPGIATSSYGIACAKVAGLPHSIICRAANIIGDIEAGQEPRSHNIGALPLSINSLLENATVRRALRAFLERRGGWKDIENIPTKDYEDISTVLQDLTQLPTSQPVVS